MSARSSGRAAGSFKKGRFCWSAIRRPTPTAVRECAAKFGLHSGTITRAVKAADGTIRAKGPVPRTADPAAVERAYVRQGKTLREVSREFGITERLASRILREEAGVELRGPRLRHSGSL